MALSTDASASMLRLTFAARRWGYGDSVTEGAQSL